MEETIITVTELNEGIKTILYENIPNIIKIKGDISNVKMSGGNTFLTLKDKQSSVNITCWNKKINNLNNGDEVIIEGKLNCFTKNGTYQVNANTIEKIGIGMLHEEYIKLKKNFEKKGYFNKSINKINFPDCINSIGILTASEGAALQDILYVLQSNAFNGKVFIKNCMVQGINCPKSISDGIKFFNTFNKKNKIDILVISRGGGSFEDLMGFSSKDVVKSIYKTKIYTISAVGHEIDNMLSDYSANYRAPTPSIAAEVVSSINKKKKDMINLGQTKLMELQNLIKFKLNTYESKIESSKKILSMIDPENIITEYLNTMDHLQNIIYNKISNNINLHIGKVNKLININNNYDNSKILGNGYTMILDKDDNLITSLVDFKKLIGKEKIKLVFSDGSYDL
jgi:exodeoxyribonuclease VII large subunit